MRRYYVYIMTNKGDTVLYTGMTNHLERRVREHKEKRGSPFTRRYNIQKLVYFEEYAEVRDAIAREKQIKAGSCQKKIDLVDSMNPTWRDLAADFFRVMPTRVIASRRRSNLPATATTRLATNRLCIPDYARMRSPRTKRHDLRSGGSSFRAALAPLLCYTSSSESL
jgi:putative endonuclease